MSQNFFSQAINTKTRLKRRAVMSRYFMWIIIVSFFSVFKETGDGCDGSINQLGRNVLESHRRFWLCSKTGAVSDPAAMAFPFPLWKRILSYINPISAFINTHHISVSCSFMPLLLFPPVFPVPRSGSSRCLVTALLLKWYIIVGKVGRSFGMD